MLVNRMGRRPRKRNGFKPVDTFSQRNGAIGGVLNGPTRKDGNMWILPGSNHINYEREWRNLPGGANRDFSSHNAGDRSTHPSGLGRTATNVAHIREQGMTVWVKQTFETPVAPQKPPCLDDLSLELIILLLGYLPIVDVVRLGLVNKKLRRVLKDEISSTLSHRATQEEEMSYQLTRDLETSASILCPICLKGHCRLSPREEATELAPDSSDGSGRP